MGSPERGPAELDEASRLRSLFAACDVNGSGRIERDDFGALCAELRLPPAEAEAIFQRLDSDQDGAVTFQEFARGFRGAAPLKRRLQQPRRPWRRLGREEASEAEMDLRDEAGGAADEATAASGTSLAGDPSQAWRAFEGRLGEEAAFIPR